MVTRILFDPRRDLPDGTTTSAPVVLEATPTNVRYDGSVVVLPTSLDFTINTGADVVQLAPPAASWAWRLTARQGNVIKLRRIVRFPDVPSITWADLTDVNPDSLVATQGTLQQYDLIFWQLMTIIGNGGGGTNYATIGTALVGTAIVA